MKKAFEVSNPDYQLSPLTGMTKQHYIELGKYLLEKAFTHINTVNVPLTFPSVPGKTYPQPGAPDWRYRALEFEALERTFTIAGPLIHLDHDVEIKGIRLKDYYSLQLYNSLTPGHTNSLPKPEELPDFAVQMNLEILPITPTEASSFYKLPKRSHKDPFVRLIIWQAIQRKMTLVSKDRDFKAYHKLGLKTFW